MKGVFTALITPFKKSGEVDYAAFEKLLKLQGDAGIHGIVPCGTTGESATLNEKEKKKLIEMSVRYFNGSKVKVIAGTGSNNTETTVDLSRWASMQRVDGILVVTPYYNRPSQKGLLAHYKAVSEAIDCELVPYNVPARTGVSFTTETIVKLGQMKNVTGLKEATANIGWNAELIAALKVSRSKMDLLTGDDPTFLPFLSIGGAGIISVASNLIPQVLLEIYNKKNSELFLKWTPLFKSLFIECNPGPIKFAMNKVYGLPSHTRLPLVKIEPQTEKILLPLIRPVLRGIRD
ncbi:MAG: 4-hydroxy-tetrahydrodipicolinate synthase [Xanthomonadaceae bacterium]|nr:4-hydroxy-tetrahydrodipicolinate synthase [Xanthomonadaceae bacterium]